MATQKITFLTQHDKGQYTYPLAFTGDAPAGALPTATAIEYAFVMPFAGELDDNPLILSVGTNGTHADFDLTATLEKNGDGGTSMLATAPHILNDAGTGFRTTAAAGTGLTLSAPSATLANKRFAKGDILFVTLSESGSGGAEVADVGFVLLVHRLGDKDPDQTVNQ